MQKTLTIWKGTKFSIVVVIAVLSGWAALNAMSAQKATANLAVSIETRLNSNQLALSQIHAQLGINEVEVNVKRRRQLQRKFKELIATIPQEAHHEREIHRYQIKF